MTTKTKISSMSVTLFHKENDEIERTAGSEGSSKSQSYLVILPTGGNTQKLCLVVVIVT